MGERGLEARHTQGTDWQMQRVLMLSASGVMMGLKLSSKSLGLTSKGRGSNEVEDNFATHASGAIWWIISQLMQMTQPGGPIWN